MMIKFLSRFLTFILLISLIITPTNVSVEANDLTMKSFEYESQKNLYIDVGGANIIFTNQTNKIKVSKKLKVKLKENSIYIRSPRRFSLFGFLNNNEHKIVIGYKSQFNQIEIDAGGAKIEGNIAADKIYLDGGGLDLKADIIGDIISIDGGGIDIDGKLKVQEVAINGAGMNIRLELSNTEELILNGAGIDAYIKYLDKWKGQRSLKMNGVGGDLDIYVPNDKPEEIMGDLKVETNGIIDVDINYY